MKKLIGISSILFTIIVLTGCGANGSNASTPEVNKNAKTIYIKNFASYAENSRIQPSIKKECNLNSQIIDYLKIYGAKNNINFVVTSDMKSHKNTLELIIDDAVSSGNAFIGHRKFVSISGKLKNQGEDYSFKAARKSGGGFFGAYKSSCAVLGGTVKRLARDTAEWASMPNNNARLGDIYLLR
jgi:hypothetical protein